MKQYIEKHCILLLLRTNTILSILQNCLCVLLMLSIQLLQLCQNAILEDSGLIHHELTNNIDSVELHIRPFSRFLMTESLVHEYKSRIQSIVSSRTPWVFWVNTHWICEVIFARVLTLSLLEKTGMPEQH